MGYWQYHPSLYNNLRYQFDQADRLALSYSQMHQDLFVLSLLDGKQNGTYLEIGAHHPIEVNNTYLLESMYNWRGVSFELDPYLSEMFRQKRINPIIEGDATAVDYKKIIEEHTLGNIIDYLSVDIEPPMGTFETLKMLPHDEVKFRIITFEHCAGVPEVPEGLVIQLESREFLHSLGYEMIIPDVGNETYPGNPDIVVSVEDWWYHPDLVDDSLAEKLKIISEKPVSSRLTVYDLENTNLMDKLW